MSAQSLEPMLMEQSFLKQLDAGHIKTLAEGASLQNFQAGEYVFREGENANVFYLIRQGNVALEVYAAGRGPLTVETLGAGEVLGWSWIVPPYRWRFSARALEVTRTIVLDGASIREACDKNPAFGYAVLKRFSQVIAHRLAATRVQLLDVFGAP